MLPPPLRVLVVVSLLISPFYVADLPAQRGPSIEGLVRDASGAPVAGATVELLLTGQVAATAVTDRVGRYRLDAPERVPLEIRVHRDGFADALLLVNGASGAITRDVTLRIGGVSDTLVVTASRNLESRTTVTESVTTFDSADIERLGSASLADVMRFVPGVNIESAGREGALTAMFSRGGESDYNLVLIDGVRVNQSGGAFDFGRVNTADIGRVEVVRGAQSSLWGSDAMGAVVQIFTKSGTPQDGPRITGSFEGGSFGTVRSSARVVGGARQWMDYHTGMSVRRTGGAFADLLPDGDGFKQLSFDAGLGAVVGRRASIRSAIRHERADGKSVGPIGLGVVDSGGVYDTQSLSGSVTASHVLGAQLTGTASFNIFRSDNRSADIVGGPESLTFAILEGTPGARFPGGTRLVRVIDADEFNALVAAGATPGQDQFLASARSFDFPFTSQVELRRRAFRYQADYSWGNGQRLSAGYEWEREATPGVAGFELDNNAAFVQQQFTFADRWYATVGGRLDGKDQYDAFFSPRLSLGGFLIPSRNGGLSSLKVFGNVGKGIKAPTFAERFGGSFADPSPNLRAERARTGDVGLEATFASQRFRALVTYFDNDYVDQVAFRSGVAGDGVPEFINIDGSKTEGWEIEWALQRPFAGLTASASYTLLHSRVVTNISSNQQFQPGEPLLRRPRHSGTVRAAYTRNRITVATTARVVSDRHDSSFLSFRTVPNASLPTAVTTDITVNPGYVVVGAGVDFNANRALAFFIRSDNVGDVTYENAIGYPALGRAVMAGMRFRLGS